MAKLSQMMTRIVAVGTLKEYKYDFDKPTSPGKGILTADNGNQVRFTIFNKANGDKPHTKAEDFANQFSVGDKVYITGQDSRQADQNDGSKFYENIMVWDFRVAEDTEPNRWVYVYVGDVKELTDDSLELSFINYKNEEMIYPINFLEQTKKPLAGLEVGARIKVKGMIFSGFKADFFGEGEYITERTAAEITLLNTADEVAADGEDSDSESGLWND